MKRAIALGLILAVVGAAVWFFERGSDVPQVPFAKAARQTISNVLTTNGKLEPIEYREVRVEARGLVTRVLVHTGQDVKQGEVLAQLSDPGLQQEIDAARAREAQVRADLSTLDAGGSSAETAELEGSLNRLKSDRAAAQKNLDALLRLQEKQAATGYEVEQARQALQSMDVQMQSLERRRSSLVGKGDLAGARARVSEAEANVSLATRRLDQGVIRAPVAGTIYDLPARAGAYLNPGDPVASIGKLDPMRVRVYVDEPELGRVSAGENVRITWDALPGREWNGTVEKRPSEVVAQGSRQVGEVLCTIASPDRQLLPGTNVNAFILTQVVNSALTIPKAAVRRDNGAGVFLLQADGVVRWRAIRTGASDALRVEVLSGLSDGDAVAERSDVPLKDGMKVRAAGR